MVAPFVGAWIEISLLHVRLALQLVAPFVGAWIEIALAILSLALLAVAPFVGAWIEIWKRKQSVLINKVAPFVGAWIEIPTLVAVNEKLESHPLWVRGLKYSMAMNLKQSTCRTLCGCVD